MFTADFDPITVDTTNKDQLIYIRLAQGDVCIPVPLLSFINWKFPVHPIRDAAGIEIGQKYFTNYAKNYTLTCYDYSKMLISYLWLTV